MSLIKVVPYVLGLTPGVPGAPEPRMYPHSGYFLVYHYFEVLVILAISILQPAANGYLQLKIEFLPFVFCSTVHKLLRIT